MAKPSIQSAAFLILAVVLAGCATLTGSSGRLVEPVPVPATVRTYAADSVDSTLSIPVSFEAPGRSLSFSAVRVNPLGETVPDGVFDGGAIVEREFGKVVDANYRLVRGEEHPVAVFRAGVSGVTARRVSMSGECEASVRVSVSIARADGGEKCYEKEFFARAEGLGTDGREVPPPVYAALGEVVAEFLGDFSRSVAPGVLRKWAGEAKGGVEPPSLREMEWAERGGGVQAGRCVVDCNGYEGFDAKAWAAARIFADARRRLGGIAPERVRVVYGADGESFDAAAKSWTLMFLAFARTPCVFEYSDLTRSGTVIGDIELLGFGNDIHAAAEKLRDIVHREIDVRVGPVSSEIRKGKALVRFGDFKMDVANGLLIQPFRVPYAYAE